METWKHHRVLCIYYFDGPRSEPQWYKLLFNTLSYILGIFQRADFAQPQIENAIQVDFSFLLSGRYIKYLFLTYNATAILLFIEWRGATRRYRFSVNGQ